MFDFGLGELLLVGVVALIVLGPERLPQAARTAGRLVGKLQGFVNNVKQELNTQAELDELRKVKQEFETAASEFRDGIKDLGNDAQKKSERYFRRPQAVGTSARTENACRFRCG